MDDSIKQPWFAVQVRPKYEKLVESCLRGKGYEVLLPLYRSRRRWSDRVKVLELPLFPSYLFCRFNVDARLPIIVTPAVIRIVGIGKTPFPVDEHEMAAIQAVVASGLPAQPFPCIKIGQRVRIEVGALAGVEGTLVAVKGRSRIVVCVSLLQRAVAVNVDLDWVTPLGSNQRSAAFSFPSSTRRGQGEALRI